MRYAGLLFLTLAGLVCAQDGEALYKERCASCHDSPEGRVPPIGAIKQMTAQAVYSAMTSGAMQSQVSGLSLQGVLAILAYIAPAGGEGTKPAFDKNGTVTAGNASGVNDGAAAMIYLEKNPLPSVVILDLSLPKVSGLDVLKKMRNNSRTKHIPVVVLTTSDSDADILKSYELKCSSYIVKPVSFDKFMDVAAQIELYWGVLNLPWSPPGTLQD